MTSKTSFPIPCWVSPGDKQKFAVALAAVYHNPSGSIAKLSEALGLSHATLHMALKSSDGLRKSHCLALEALLGRDLFPREFFAPELFADEG